MSGHSKWANIKHKKGANDAKRQKIFTKISKEISIAVQSGGNDPSSNSSLRLAVEKAKSANMPADNIKRLLVKVDKGGDNWKEINYEGYGPGGVAVLVASLTDNINRTAASVKAAFVRSGGNLGTDGSVSYLFETKGIIVLDSNLYESDNVMKIILEANILDMKEEDGVIIIETNSKDLIQTKELLESKGISEFLSSEVTKLPTNKVPVDEATAKKLEHLIEALEDNDDVQEVYTNVE